jgi:hypothetical protein
MRESNLALIAQINAQREANRSLKMTVQADIGRIRHYANAPKKKSVSGGNASQSSKQPALTALPYIANADGTGGRPMQTPTNNEFVEPFELLEKNRRRILSLRAAIAELGERNAEANQLGGSRTMLPPIDAGTIPRQIEQGPASSPPQEFGDSFAFGDSQVNLSLETAGGGQHMGYGQDKPEPAVPTYATEYKSPRAEETVN